MVRCCGGATGPSNVAASRWCTTSLLSRTVESACAGSAGPTTTASTSARSATLERPLMCSSWTRWGVECGAESTAKFWPRKTNEKHAADEKLTDESIGLIWRREICANLLPREGGASFGRGTGHFSSEPGAL